MTKHRYTAFIDDDLFQDMKKVKSLTGYSINRLLNRAARKTLDEVMSDLHTHKDRQERLHNTRTSL